MRNPRRSGFTVVELLVSLSLFAIVVSIATGAFIRALRTQRQLVAFAAANSNVSLVLEQMAREIRVSKDFAGTDTALSFTNARGEAVTYAFQDNGTSGSIMRTVDNQGTLQLTAENVNVRDLRFRLQFAQEDDGYPARVTVSLSISPIELGISTSVVRIQTTVSARSLAT
jgi:prepilin-type N-terminal cleavage/methylation domain-containing protein